MEIVKLNSKNGLYNFVNNIVASGLEMYLDNRVRKVSIYYSSLKNGWSINRLQLAIANYIDRHMLMDSYKKIDIYS